MEFRRRRRSIVTITLMLAAVGTVSCQRGRPDYYQGISVATSYGYDLSGRTDRVRGFVYKIDDLAGFRDPGLVFLARDLNLAHEAYVEINDHHYDIPAIDGDLLGKVVLPIDPNHLRSGINEARFFMNAGSDGFEVLDSRMETVAETEATVIARTYRVAARGRGASIDDFDFIAGYSGEGIRERSSVPLWTERGKVRFYRGGINFNKLDRMFEMFEQAHINLVMLRVPVDKSSDNYKQIKEFIDSCHDKGIMITASFSLGGIRLREALMDPSLLDWVSLDEYGERRWRRRGGTYLADLTNTDYRAEQMKAAEAAIDAGADELYYDWAIGGTGEVIQFFNDVRELAAGKGRNVSIYGNCKGNILVDMICDITKSESTAEAGVWDGKWVHNVAQSRFYYAVGDGWKPYRSKYEGANPGEPHPQAYDIQQEMKRGWKRPIAEAAAFQSHFAIAENGAKLRDGWIFENNELAMTIWDEICRYNEFLDRNEQLYTDVRVLSKIGVLAPPRVPSYEYRVRRTPIYDALAEMNVMYDVLLLPRISEGMLARYKAIVIADLPFVTDEQLKIIRNYQARGGKVFTVGSSSQLQDLADIKEPASMVNQIGTATTRNKFRRMLTSLAGEPIVSLQGGQYVIANVVKKTDSDRVIVHLINYSNTVKNLRVSLNLEGFVADVQREQIKTYSPDTTTESIGSISVNGKRVQLTIPELDIYNIVTIN